MGSIRVCPGCKAEFSLDFKGTVCPVCRAELAEQFCRYCFTWKPSDEYYYASNKKYRRTECKNCGRLRKLAFDKKNRDQSYERDKRFWDKRKEALKTQYTEWKTRTDALQFKMLSEEQWLETCNHFGGCAICGDDHIETRQYFIPFRDGGKYTTWNIFPMCGKCSTHAKRLLNPFTWFDRYYGRQGLMVTPEAGKKLVDYLELQIEKAGKTNEQ